MAGVQQTRWDKMLRRTANVVGEGAIVTETLQEVFPVFDLEDPPNELQRLGGTAIAFGGSTLAGVAAQAGRYQLFNPANSGHLITMVAVYFTVNGTSVVRWGIVNQAIASVGTQRFRDTRGVFTALPVGSINAVSSVALAPATGQVRTLTAVPWRMEEPKGLFVLAPGTGFEIGASALNTITHCTFDWRERQALESELDL